MAAAVFAVDVDSAVDAHSEAVVLFVGAGSGAVVRFERVVFVAGASIAPGAIAGAVIGAGVSMALGAIAVGVIGGSGGRPDLSRPAIGYVGFHDFQLQRQHGPLDRPRRGIGGRSSTGRAVASTTMIR